MTEPDAELDDDPQTDGESEADHPRPVSIDEIDRDAVSRVIHHAALQGVRLRMVHSEFTLFEPPTGWAARAFFRWNSHLAFADEGEFSAHAQFLLRYSSDLDASDDEATLPDYDVDDPPAIELMAAFELSYSLGDPEAVSELDLEHFCVLNGSANAWPYWREFAHSVTSRMGLEPFLAPLLPVPAFASEEL